MKNANEIVIGKPVKINHVLIGAAAIVILSLFVTGFGYLPWWVFLIVLILGIFITLPTCFNSYWRINEEEVKITSYSNNDAVKLMHGKPVDMTVATFDKMIAYIDKNYQQKIELEDIAQIGGYNVNYTSQFFKRQLGVSFLEYLLRMRLREATVRLANSDDGVAHIASSCGFADIKAFNVAFKKHFHTTPSEYRKQAKELGRKTKLHDWKEIISTQEEDIVELLQSCLPYEHDSSYKLKLEEANQKLQVVREQLESVVKKLQS